MASELSIPPWVADEMPLYYLWGLLDSREDFQRRAEEDYPSDASGAGDDPYAYLPNEATRDEGFAVRNFEGKLSDGTAKHYYPSASKGDVMATGEQLEVLFGVNYVDEREADERN